jgi:hypothetical protein
MPAGFRFLYYSTFVQLVKYAFVQGHQIRPVADLMEGQQTFREICSDKFEIQP